MPRPFPSPALSRFTVLDLTRVRAGPTAVRQLADWGANVITIETPGTDTGEELGGARHGPDFQNLHRNMRSLTLNLKAEEGLALFKSLVKKADVVVENYRPDVKFRLGVDYETLKEINPRLVYASISGFGQNGPYKDRPGFDQRTGTAIADLSSGLFCALGILVALLERETSGAGQWVQTSLLQAQIFMLDFQASRWLMDREVPQQAGNDHPTIIPTGVFATTDGHINIATAGQETWLRLCKAIERDDLIGDPNYATASARSQHRAALNAHIAACIKTRSKDEWIEILNRAGVPCGPIYSVDQVFADPQVKHLGIAQSVHHPVRGDIELVAQAVTLSRTPSKLKSAAPDRGEHTSEVLREFGFADPDIGGLRSRGVI
jgi:crotonobetainyl-CoA:carnitine CoA-transferase CaiB-like acyl-CoA transferase